MQTLQFVAILLAIGFAFRAKAAVPTTNPVDLEQAAAERLEHLPEPAAIADDVVAVPLDASVRQYLAERKDVAELLRQAAMMPNASWPAVGDDIAPVLKSLNGPRRAANFLRLQARQDLADGLPGRAVDDLLAAIAVGRHAGQQKLLVNQLVAAGCEAVGMNGLATMLPQLPRDQLNALPAKLAALPPAATLSETVDAERAFGGVTLHRQLTTPVNPNATQPSDIGLGASPASTAFAMRMWEAIAPLYDAAKTSAALPPDDFAKAIDQAAAKLMMNPMAGVLAPAWRSMRETFAVTEARHAMLLAAIEVCRNGPDTIADSKDPFGHGPFAYTATPGGFRLTTALTVSAKSGPVSLDVGQ